MKKSLKYTTAKKKTGFLAPRLDSPCFHFTPKTQLISFPGLPG